MENLSHTLIGLAAGELTHRSLKPEAKQEDQSLRRKLLLTASALAGNFPDLDIVLTPLLPEPLGYLLHHRGHTHTFLYALPQALLLGIGIYLLWPKARALLNKSACARKGYLGMLFLGFALHIGLDALNTYGIHPFHPFDSDWYYGDAVFIVEPIFWFLFSASLCANSTLKTKLLTFVPILGICSVFTYAGFLAWQSLLGLALLFGMVASPRGKNPLIAAFVLALIYCGALKIASEAAFDRVERIINKERGGMKVKDVSLSSFPSQPLCWMFVSISSNEKQGQYEIHKGSLSLFPNLFAASQCPSRFLKDESVFEQGAQYKKYVHPLEELRTKNQENCFFQAWMRFARMPRIERSQAWDERFQRGSRADNFTLLDLKKFPAASCPEGVPQWNPPRLDIL